MDIKTIEARWFYTGILPDEVLKWFNTLGDPLAAPDSRADFYLQSSSPEIGLKIRQGNLEVKHRQQQLGTIDLDKFGSTQIEQWTKWICNDRAAHPPEFGKQGWIQVDKVRYQRFYQVEFEETIELTSIATPRKNAAAIEITQLHLRQPWWTIACEYLGDNISIDRQFLPLIRSLVYSYPYLTSAPIISSGYPEWLTIATKNFSGFTE
jgi:hypothetical protein